MPKFSLQSVLDYRHSRVEIIELEMGQLLSEQRLAQNFLDRLEALKEGILHDLSASQMGDLDLDRLSQLQANQRILEKQIVEHQAHLEEISSRVEAKRLKLVHARQDEEVLQILKDKENETHLNYVARQESRLQDDIYIAQAYRHA